MKINPSNLIPRSAWGAREDDGFDDRDLPVTEWWLHHSVTIAPDLLPPFDDDDAAIRTLERIGQARFGGGISYTVPITPVGRAYVGHSFWRRGAHTRGHNTVGAAICLVGNYDTTAPTAAQIEAAARTMVAAHRQGLAATHQLTGGHRDVFSTGCPGRHGYAAIPAINRRARELWAASTPAKDWFDMATKTDLEEAVTEKAGGAVLSTTVGRTGLTVGVMLDRIYRAVSDPDALADAVAARLPEQDAAAVKAAVKAALREGVA